LILHTIKCKGCGGQFKAECSARRYCSEECNKDAIRKRSKKHYDKWNKQTKQKRVYTKREMPLFEALYVRLFTTPHDIYMDKQMEYSIQEIEEKYP